MLDTRRLVEGVTALPGYTRSVGTQVLLAESGRVHMALRKRPGLLQFNGFFHGGVIAGLADHAAGAAVTTALPAGRIAITVDMHVQFLSPADGDAILAKARAIRAGKTICAASVEVLSIIGTDERTCAVATATLRAVDMPASASFSAMR